MTLCNSGTKTSVHNINKSLYESSELNVESVVMFRISCFTMSGTHATCWNTNILISTSIFCLSLVRRRLHSEYYKECSHFFTRSPWVSAAFHPYLKVSVSKHSLDYSSEVMFTFICNVLLVLYSTYTTIHIFIISFNMFTVQQTLLEQFTAENI